MFLLSLHLSMELVDLQSLDREKVSLCNKMHDLPVTTNSGDGLEAARCQLVRSSEAAVYGPVEQIDLVWVQF